MIGIDVTCFYGFQLLASENIFDIIVLNSYKEYNGDMMRERIQRIITMLHPDQLNGTERISSADVNQIKVNLVKDFSFNRTEFWPAQ